MLLRLPPSCRGGEGPKTGFPAGRPGAQGTPSGCTGFATRSSRLQRDTDVPSTSLPLALSARSENRVLDYFLDSVVGEPAMLDEAAHRVSTERHTRFESCAQGRSRFKTRRPEIPRGLRYANAFSPALLGSWTAYALALIPFRRRSSALPNAVQFSAMLAGTARPCAEVAA